MGRFVEVGNGVGASYDAHAAGAAAATQALEAIARFTPSLAIVFASGLLDPEEVARGVTSVTGGCPMVGTSSAGEICCGHTEGTVVVTVLASPYLSAQVGVGEGLSVDWEQAVRAALPRNDNSAYFRDAPKLGRPFYFAHPASGLSPLFGLLFSPGVSMERPSYSYDVHTFLKQRTLGRVPIVGGCSGHPRFDREGFQLANGRSYRDAVVLALVETDLLFGIGVAHGFRPTRRHALVTKARGHMVQELDDRPAAEVCAELMAVDPDTLRDDPLSFSRHPFGSSDSFGQHNLILPERVAPDGGVQFGPNMDGIESITLMEIDPDRQGTAAQEAVAKAMEIGYVDDPAAILLFSCALRRSLGDASHEIERGGVDRVAGLAPTSGCLADGEYGLTMEGLPIACNLSVVALVIGNELDQSAVATRRRVDALQAIEAQYDRRSRELDAVRRAHEIILDADHWRDQVGQFERILRELTGAHSVAFKVDPSDPGWPDDADITAAGSDDCRLVLPLVSLGQHIGVAVIEGDVSLTSREAAATICQRVGRGIHRVALERTIDEQAREIDAVHSIAHEVIAATDYREALANIARQISAHVGATCFTLWIGDEPEVLSFDAGGATVPTEVHRRLAEQAVATGVVQRLRLNGTIHVATPLAVKDHISGALVHGFAGADATVLENPTFMSYLTITLAVMAELFMRSRESDVAREIHHRVKNNLQIIASLLNLQLRRLDDAGAREPLESSIRRIMSIAVVHEALCERHAGLVDALALIRTVVDYVVQGMSGPGQRLEVSVEGAAGVMLASQQATNLAVVVNELIGNALKHGLRFRPEGRVEVRLEPTPTGFELTVRDDGRGLPPGFELAHDQGLGLQLISSIARSEFAGSFWVEPGRPHGVEAHLVFPRDPVLQLGPR